MITGSKVFGEPIERVRGPGFGGGLRFTSRPVGQTVLVAAGMVIGVLACVRALVRDVVRR